MGTPRTSPSSSSSPSRNERHIALSLAAYGLHFFIVSSVGWPGSTSPLSEQPGIDSPCGPFMLSENIAFCLVFFLWLLAALTWLPRLRQRAGRVFASVLPSCLLVAGLLLALPASSLADAPALAAVRGALLGAGLGGNFVLCQNAACQNRPRTAALVLIGGTIAGPALIALLAWLPDAVLHGTVLVAALACGGILAALNPDIGPAPATVDPSSDPASAIHSDASAHLRKGILSLLAPTVAISTIGVVLQISRSFTTAVGGDQLAGAPLGTGLALGAVTAFVLYHFTQFRINTDLYGRYLLPVAALALVFFPFGGPLYQNIATIALYMAFGAASIDLILACNLSSRFYGIPRCALYALLFGITYTFRFAALMLPSLAGSHDASPAAAPSLMAAFLCIALLFAAYVFVVWYGALQRREAVFTWSSHLQPAATPEEPTQESFDRFARSYGLTNREAEVAKMFTEGRSIPYIAERLHIAESTVKFHSRSIYQKCGASDRQEFLDIFQNFFELLEQ